MESNEDGTIYVDESDGIQERLYHDRVTERTVTDVLDTNKELLQEFESVSAALRSKAISLSKVANERVQDSMKTLIEMMRKMDVELATELNLHRSTHSNGPHLARRIDLPLTGRPPNHTPIRLAKRASLKPKRTQQEHESVEEMSPDEIQCCI
ncbi:hypothetical protein OSTOST_25189, partial [Ostertagia ostertagi]